MTDSTVLVTGNTYPVKEQIKALGGRWDAANKGWRVPADKAAEAQALVAGAPKSAPRNFRRSTPGYARAPRRVGTCWECGFYGSLNSDGECGYC